MDGLERKTPPFSDETDLPSGGVHWIRPELVAEVGFTEWTDEHRLRHPRFLGLRQVPGTLGFDRARVRDFLEGLPHDTDAALRLARRHDDRIDEPFLESPTTHRIRHVLEVRHESWLVPELVRACRETGTALAISHAADWPCTEELTARFVYLRLHGAPHTYASRYDADVLRRWARRIGRWSDGDEPEDPARITDRKPPRRKGRDAYVYFDNDQEGRAPRDARRLARLLEEGR